MPNLRNALCFSLLLLASEPLALAQGTYTQIDYPGGISTAALGIDGAGDIVGWYMDGSNVQHGFVLSGNVYTTIDAPGASGVTAVTGINDLGQVVGYSFGATGATGFLYDLKTSTFTTIQYGSSQTYATGLNNAGTIVGYVYLTTTATGFEYVGTSFKKELPNGASESALFGISSSGVAVGSCSAPLQTRHKGPCLK